MPCSLRMTIIIIKLIPYLEFGSANGVLPDTIFLQFLQYLLFTVILMFFSSVLVISLTIFVYEDVCSERLEPPQLLHVCESAVSSTSILSGRLRPLRSCLLGPPLDFLRLLVPLLLFFSDFAPILFATAADTMLFASCNSVSRFWICLMAVL